MILDIMPIPLTQGLFAIVDGDDYECIAKHKWYAEKHSRNFYATRKSPKINGYRHSIRMHREVLGAKKGQQFDHKNRCGLDNRKNNLRPCSVSQNQQNREAQTNNSSGYKGVHWGCRDRKWIAKITHHGKAIFLGCFNDKIKAVKAYDKKARELFGEFAYINLPLGAKK